MRFIALCGLTVAVIYGVAFTQDPPPTATPTPSPSKRSSSSDVSERERILLERIEQLERRLNELESRLNARATTTENSAAPIASLPPVVGSAAPMFPANTSQHSADAQPPRLAAVALPNVAAPSLPSLTNTNTVPSANIAVSAPQPTQPARQPTPSPPAAWDKDGVKIVPYGILIANLNYNSSALAPGSFAGFAFPNAPENTAQFNISPGNAYLGVDIKWPKIGEWEINGKVDFDLRGPTPLRVNNIFAPLFINVYGEAKTERYRILAGQAPDIISPLFSNSLNI